MAPTNPRFREGEFPELSGCWRGFILHSCDISHIDPISRDCALFVVVIILGKGIKGETPFTKPVERGGSAKPLKNNESTVQMGAISVPFGLMGQSCAFR